jgi:hypothetical protein
MKTINEIGGKYDFVLVDNCVIDSGILTENFSFGDARAANHLNKKNNHLDVLRRFSFEYNLLYLTPGVFEEFKPIPSMYSPNDARTKKMIAKYNRRRELFSREIKQRGKILELSSEEEKIGKNFDAFYLSLLGEFELSAPDYEFVRNGLAVTRTRGNVCLISNDGSSRSSRGIYDLWGEVLRRDKLSFEQFGFFFRLDQERFVSGDTKDLGAVLRDSGPKLEVSLNLEL